MALIKDWIYGFLKRHLLRYPSADWPDPHTEDGQEFVKLWFQAFKLAGVTEVEADTASVRLASNPPRFRTDHIPAIIREVEAIRRANAAAATPHSRDEAERLARDCPRCEGLGLVLVFHPGHDGSPRAWYRKPNGENVLGPSRVAGHCTCALGRWMRSRTEPEMKRRIPDLADIEAGISRWWVEDRTEAEALS